MSVIGRIAFARAMLSEIHRVLSGRTEGSTSSIAGKERQRSCLTQVYLLALECRDVVLLTMHVFHEEHLALETIL